MPVFSNWIFKCLNELMLNCLLARNMMPYSLLRLAVIIVCIIILKMIMQVT